MAALCGFCGVWDIQYLPLIWAIFQNSKSTYSHAAELSKGIWTRSLQTGVPIDKGTWFSAQTIKEITALKFTPGWRLSNANFVRSLIIVVAFHGIPWDYSQLFAWKICYLCLEPFLLPMSWTCTVQLLILNLEPEGNIPRMGMIRATGWKPIVRLTLEPWILNLEFWIKPNPRLIRSARVFDFWQPMQKFSQHGPGGPSDPWGGRLVGDS